jgi:hypothetical protein
VRSLLHPQPDNARELVRKSHGCGAVAELPARLDATGGERKQETLRGELAGPAPNVASVTSQRMHLNAAGTAGWSIAIISVSSSV